MVTPIEFVALSDTELQALVLALQKVRMNLPWQALSLRAHAHAWVLRVAVLPAQAGASASSADCAALYAQVQALRTGAGSAPATVTHQAHVTARAGHDRLSQFMQQASGPWPPLHALVNAKAAAHPASGTKGHGQPKHSGKKAGGKSRHAGQDWRGHNFAGQDLRAADFSDADLRGANFSGANLQGACLQRARLGMPDAAARIERWRLPLYRLAASRGRYFSFCAAVVPGLALLTALLTQPGYAGSSLLGLIAIVSMLLLDTVQPRLRQALANGGTRFDGANLSQADFSGAQIGLVNFEQAQLQQVRWHDVQWQTAPYFSAAALRQPAMPGLLAGQRQMQDFSGHDLSQLDLSGFDLSGFDLSDANLQGTNLRGCNLQNARLLRADLRAANLQHAGLSGCWLSDWQIDFSTRLEQVDCTHWHAQGLPDGRWPPAPHTLRAGEFSHLVCPSWPCVRFVVPDLAQLPVWFDTILMLQPKLPIRIVEIHIDADPARYGHADRWSPPEPVAGNADGNAAGERDIGSNLPANGYLIDLQADASLDLLQLCQRVWVRVQQRLQPRQYQAAASGVESLLAQSRSAHPSRMAHEGLAVTGDRLLSLLASLDGVAH